MTMNDLAEILEVVERLRKELHPDLDARFLRAVVQAEEVHPDDPDAVHAIQQALDQVAKGLGAS